MNANELIEELEDTGSFFEDALYLKSAALLRQQQDEIAVLTKFLEETCQIGKFIVWNSSDKVLEK